MPIFTTLSGRFSSRIFIQSLTVIIPRMTASLPTPFHEKHPHTIMDPTPCLNVDFKFLCSNCAPFFRQTYCRLFELFNSNLDSSVHIIDFQKLIVLFKCLCANSRRFLRFTSEIYSFLRATLPCKLNSFILRLIVLIPMSSFNTSLISCALAEGFF